MYLEGKIKIDTKNNGLYRTLPFEFVTYKLDQPMNGMNVYSELTIDGQQIDNGRHNFILEDVFKYHMFNNTEIDRVTSLVTDEWENEVVSDYYGDYAEPEIYDETLNQYFVEATDFKEMLIDALEFSNGYTDKQNNNLLSYIETDLDYFLEEC